MDTQVRPFTRRRGQTLIIAMIVLGLLLILGFVFLGIVDRNIKGGANARVRSQSEDLAEAGIQYAFAQLVDSPAGADWRGAPTTVPPVATTGAGVNFTRDPDAFYLRPASGAPLPNHLNQNDLGGPDGLGPYFRINYAQGRSLVRVRYGPSDVNIFNASPVGPIRNPGLVRNYLILESVGRQGSINTNDPTTLSNSAGIQFQGITTTPELQASLSAMQKYDSQIPNSLHKQAFATTGLIDNARFITNKFKVNRPADIGASNPGPNDYLPGVGASYNGTDVGLMLETDLGTNQSISGPGSTIVPPGEGSLMSNADVTFHGTTKFYLNGSFGDQIKIAGNVVGEENSVLDLAVSTYNATANTWTTALTNLNPTSFDSRSPGFTTDNNMLIDGMAGSDASGYARGVGRVSPPSILRVDPSTKLNRYLELSRGTGTSEIQGSNGHGSGVYVGNTTDVQAPSDEAGRAGAGSSESLLYDWLNPNNGTSTSGWEGSFYVPVGAYVQLLPDGFTITLDNGNWPDQATQRRRYRVGMVANQQYILDDEVDPADINSAAGLPYATKGTPFNGVLYFEGNVRVRGTIPTDVQLTLVSGATIYIEGSIVKGAIGNDVTDAYSTADPRYALYNTPVTRLSHSTLMLMAKDYVAVNTTQFFGLTNGQSVQVVNDQQNDTNYDAIDMSPTPGAASGELNFTTDFVTDPLTGTSSNPATYVPYAMEYTDSLNTGTPLNTKLLLAHTMADGQGSASFIGMNVNLGIGNSLFSFPGTNTLLPYPNIDNTASDYLNSGALSIGMYGLGKETWQRYDKFESRGFNLIYPSESLFNPLNGLITNVNLTRDPFIGYSLSTQGSNTLTINASSIVGVTGNDYLLARAAVAPFDVRIEASIYAEEGSFAVIPGPWFNPNPNDTRANFEGRVSALQGGGGSQANAMAEASQERLEAYGTAPEVPFYGEPLDVRVQIVGSVSENMPPPNSVQNQWIQKWGWIPIKTGGTDTNIPAQHIPAGQNAANTSIVPNMTISYDPALATGRAAGFSSSNSTLDVIRTDEYGRALLPMPRLPVSPVLTYFGDER